LPTVLAKSKAIYPNINSITSVYNKFLAAAQKSFDDYVPIVYQFAFYNGLNDVNVTSSFKTKYLGPPSNTSTMLGKLQVYVTSKHNALMGELTKFQNSISFVESNNIAPSIAQGTAAFGEMTALIKEKILTPFFKVSKESTYNWFLGAVNGLFLACLLLPLCLIGVAIGALLFDLPCCKDCLCRLFVVVWLIFFVMVLVALGLALVTPAIN
jgi:hypothetical protein